MKETNDTQYWLSRRQYEYDISPEGAWKDMLIKTTNVMQQYKDNPDSTAAKELFDACIEHNNTPAQEVIAIAKELAGKGLPSGINESRLIGDHISVVDNTTTITLIREPQAESLISCPVCAVQFTKKGGRGLWVNYGGVTKRKHYCSDKCRSQVEDILGAGRASKTKGNLVNTFKRKSKWE